QRKRFWRCCGGSEAYNQGMVREVEAIFEDGVLKPVEPLPLAEKQRVRVTFDDAVEQPEPPNARLAEMRWIGENAHNYKGEYVAIQDSEMVSHGKDGMSVIREARSKGFLNALVHYIPEDFGQPRFELF
ncbi:MAG TPA: DUF5678 domain-containing protein, partial [Candidatus Solibacter sp.]|nr:DUF5678 domain-containing protein [Candidatus Solibacter sp.]